MKNYRSTQPILDASNAVIKYNKERIDKDLYTKLPGDEKITMFEGKEDSEEPIFVARQINEKHKKGLIQRYGDSLLFELFFTCF